MLLYSGTFYYKIIILYFQKYIKILYKKVKRVRNYDSGTSWTDLSKFNINSQLKMSYFLDYQKDK